MTGNIEVRDLSFEYTVSIVSAYVANNNIPKDEVPDFIGAIYKKLQSLRRADVQPQPSRPPVPAVSIEQSLTPDYIICLEDGKRFRSLKRHIAAAYNLTPQQYRERWHLPADYPMIAPNYAAARSELAIKIGLGRSGTKATSAKRKAPRKRVY